MNVGRNVCSFQNKKAVTGKLPPSLIRDVMVCLDMAPLLLKDVINRRLETLVAGKVFTFVNPKQIYHICMGKVFKTTIVNGKKISYDSCQGSFESGWGNPFHL